MCGIIGYTGTGRAASILISGLKRLEYRGYDSAGVTLAGKELRTVKAVGKVRNLEAKLQETEPNPETCGIAHTCWAT
ncbi:MAG: glutamine--fructose-6-phosphate aminotransferase, partial [Victivallales bacterium]|nr:glutamine--fructose-6-phosphate aminotransferase [Victivallales bacterium]